MAGLVEQLFQLRQIGCNPGDQGFSARSCGAAPFKFHSKSSRLAVDKFTFSVPL